MPTCWQTRIRYIHPKNCFLAPFSTKESSGEEEEEVRQSAWRDVFGKQEDEEEPKPWLEDKKKRKENKKQEKEKEVRKKQTEAKLA